MVDADRIRADVIEFWHAVELFSPQKVDAVSTRNRVYRVSDHEALPWEDGHPVQRERLAPSEAWRHTVYLGIYQLEPVFTRLEAVFPAVDGTYDERTAGESAVAAFVVSEQGRALLGSEVLSSCAWAAGRTLLAGEAGAWLRQFDKAQAAFSEAFEEVFAADADDEGAKQLNRERAKDGKPPVGRPVDHHDLTRAMTMLRARLPLAQAPLAGDRPLISPEIRIKSEPVPRRNADEARETDFLNSLLTPDLQRVGDAVRAGECPPGLRAYLRDDEPEARGRVDVDDQRVGNRFVYEVTGPDRVPAGRWPAKSEHPLALSQQLAVDQIMSSLGPSSGVFAVNGPPGTGKTTMLRDVVAGLLVERARRLSQLAAPDLAFGATVTYETAGHTRRLAVLDAGITGFEMVVASSNNAAVENVTREVPGIEAIDDTWRDEAAETDYFADVAAAVLNAHRLRRPRQEWDEAWALIAAPLGNRRNCHQFAQAFWWGEEGDPKRGEPPRPAMRSFIDEGGRTLRPPAAWADAVRRFRRALEATERLRGERLADARAVSEMGAARHRAAEADDAAAQAEAALVSARQSLLQPQAALRDAEATLAQARAAAEHHRRADHPSPLESIFTLGRALRRWRAAHQPLAERVREADEAVAAITAAVSGLTARVADADRQVVVARAQRDEARRVLASAQQALDAARASLGPFLPDGVWLDGDARRRAELHAPWIDPAWNTARTRLFLAALALHKEFVAQAARRLRPGLMTAVDMMTGKAPGHLSPEIARAAWQALFLVVPVVSTTFASVARLFAHAGPETFGWLLIDEAGQATPQSAVGAIWRCRRTVAVGDPLQLEPIVSLPYTVQEAIREYHGVHGRWLPGRTSVQELADRVTTVGTYLPGPDPDEPIWVGAPLKVHRRCDQPMFDLVNDMVYGGLMVYATHRNDDADTAAALDTLPPTCWFDVSGGDASGHWLESEGKVLDRLLDDVVGAGVDVSDILALAPFRDIARQLEARGRGSGPFPGLVGGTIHRAQGKEADVVVLVLGGDPARPGAKSWAANKPNLVNVAVSRARRRLYVIGDKAEWRRHRYFDTLATRLPSA